MRPQNDISEWNIDPDLDHAREYLEKELQGGHLGRDKIPFAEMRSEPSRGIISQGEKADEVLATPQQRNLAPDSHVRYPNGPYTARIFAEESPGAVETDTIKCLYMVSYLWLPERFAIEELNRPIPSIDEPGPYKHTTDQQQSDAQDGLGTIDELTQSTEEDQGTVFADSELNSFEAQWMYAQDDTVSSPEAIRSRISSTVPDRLSDISPSHATLHSKITDVVTEKVDVKAKAATLDSINFYPSDVELIYQCTYKIPNRQPRREPATY